MSLKREVEFFLMSGYSDTDEGLARLYKTTPGSIRRVISDLRTAGMTVVKRLDRINGRVGKAKYCFIKTPDVTDTRLGRPAHMYAIDARAFR